MLRQRSRPYLFSNTLAPAIVGASIKVLELLSASTALRDKLEDNTKCFRESMTQAGFDIIPGTHAIVPVMLYDAPLAQNFAKMLLEEGVYVVVFFYLGAQKKKARIRVQLSAGHDRDHIEHAVEAFTKVGKKLGVI
jgi:glycine C-acetyltransferase